MLRPFRPSLNDSFAGPDVRTRYKTGPSAHNPAALGGAGAAGDGGSFLERMIWKSRTPVGAVVVALLAFTFWPRTPSPKPVPVPAKNDKGESKTDHRLLRHLRSAANQLHAEQCPRRSPKSAPSRQPSCLTCPHTNNHRPSLSSSASTPTPTPSARTGPAHNGEPPGPQRLPLRKVSSRRPGCDL